MSNLSGQWAALVGHGRALREAAPALLDALHHRGLRVSGALHVPVLDPSAPPGSREEVLGWDLVELGGARRRVPLARPSLEPEVCGWGFDGAAFAAERRWLDEARDTPLLLLEAARLEARGRGHWPAIEAARAAPDQLPVICLRPRALAAIALDLPEPLAALELPAEPDALAAFAAALHAAVRPPRAATTAQYPTTPPSRVTPRVTS